MRLARGLAGALWGVAGALAIFGAVGAAVLLVLAGGLIALVGGRLRWVGVALALTLAAPVAVVEYRLRVEDLRRTIDRGGPEALSVRERAGIWLLNLGMAGGGALVGFPEVALETLLLAVPGPQERTFRSSFPRGSARVRAAVDGWRPLLRTDADRVALPPVRVTFSSAGGHAEWRRGLALNPLTLDGEATRDGEGWALRLTGRVEVDYTPGARLSLVPGALWIDQTLFDALERRGDLHPYTAVWVWTERVAAR